MSSVPFSRSPLVILSVLIVVVFVLRGFVDILTGGVGSLETHPGFDSRKGSQITMLTFNIWFSPYNMQKRMEALGEIVQDMKPDILTFQEVTANNLALLQAQSWFNRYNLVPPKIDKTERYFVIILSAYDVNSREIHPFKNSEMGRKLLTAQLKVADHPQFVANQSKFVIATSHLESYGYDTKKREQQLKESIQILSAHENVCLMGDMNIHTEIDGDVVLPSSWSDAWLTLAHSSKDDGFTFDMSKNSNAREAAKLPEPNQRLDRVFCKLADFKVKAMKVVGKESKSGVLPSDHFGVYTVLERLQKPASKRKHGESQAQVYFNRPPGWQKFMKQ